jgi:hypothetical protein
MHTREKANNEWDLRPGFQHAQKNMLLLHIHSEQKTKRSLYQLQLLHKHTVSDMLHQVLHAQKDPFIMQTQWLTCGTSLPTHRIQTLCVLYDLQVFTQQDNFLSMQI